MAPIHIMATILVVFGALVMLFGRRMFVLTAGIGALIGLGVLNLVPREQVGLFAVLLVSGLAIIGGLVGLFIKGSSHVLITIIGFLAGGAITLAIFDSMGFTVGLFDLLVGLIGALIGLALANRFSDWAVVVMPAVTGALLVTRGLQLFNSLMVGIIGTTIWIILALVSFLYLSRDMREHK